MAEFPLSLTATEIDAALGKAHAPDTTLTGTLGSDPSLATAGAIRTALDNLPILTADTATTGITDSEFHGPTSAGLITHLNEVYPSQILNDASITSTFAGKNSASRRNMGLRLGALTGSSDSLVGEIAANSTTTNTLFSITLKKAGVYSFLIKFGLYGDNYVQLRKGSKVIVDTPATTVSGNQITISTPKLVSDADQTVNLEIFQNTTNSWQSAGILQANTNSIKVTRYAAGSLETL